MIRIIGITGHSGCGKSSVAAYLAQKGCACLNADKTARQVLDPAAPEWPDLTARLQNVFGYDIVRADGTLHRQRLADRAFATPAGVQTLNAITHPPILARVLAAAETAQNAGYTLFFLDGAAIVGTIFEPHCDALVLVTAPQAASLARIMARDGLTEEQARRRLAAQLPEGVLRAAADYVLENSGTLADLYRQTDALLARLTADMGVGPAPVQLQHSDREDP